VIERFKTVGGVLPTRGVAIKRSEPGSGVVVAGSAREERPKPFCAVVIPGGVVIERLKAESGVVHPAGQAKEGRSSLRRVVPRIAAIRRRADGLQRGQGPKPGDREKREAAGDNIHNCLHTFSPLDELGFYPVTRGRAANRAKNFVGTLTARAYGRQKQVRTDAEMRCVSKGPALAQIPISCLLFEIADRWARRWRGGRLLASDPAVSSRSR
jgi:hypothetical protein